MVASLSLVRVARHNAVFQKRSLKLGGSSPSRWDVCAFGWFWVNVMVWDSWRWLQRIHRNLSTKRVLFTELMSNPRKVHQRISFRKVAFLPLLVASVSKKYWSILIWNYVFCYQIVHSKLCIFAHFSYASIFCYNFGKLFSKKNKNENFKEDNYWVVPLPSLRDAISPSSSWSISWIKSFKERGHCSMRLYDEGYL